MWCWHLEHFTTIKLSPGADHAILIFFKLKWCHNLWSDSPQDISDLDDSHCLAVMSVSWNNWIQGNILKISFVEIFGNYSDKTRFGLSDCLFYHQYWYPALCRVRFWTEPELANEQNKWILPGGSVRADKNSGWRIWWWWWQSSWTEQARPIISWLPGGWLGDFKTKQRFKRFISFLPPPSQALSQVPTYVGGSLAVCKPPSGSAANLLMLWFLRFEPSCVELWCAV